MREQLDGILRKGNYCERNFTRSWSKIFYSPIYAKNNFHSIKRCTRRARTKHTH